MDPTGHPILHGRRKPTSARLWCINIAPRQLPAPLPAPSAMSSAHLAVAPYAPTRAARAYDLKTYPHWWPIYTPLPASWFGKHGSLPSNAARMPPGPDSPTPWWPDTVRRQMKRTKATWRNHASIFARRAPPWNSHHRLSVWVPTRMTGPMPPTYVSSPSTKSSPMTPVDSRHARAVATNTSWSPCIARQTQSSYKLSNRQSSHCCLPSHLRTISSMAYGPDHTHT